MHSSTKPTLDYIQSNIDTKSTIEIAKSLGMTKQNISGLITRYLPHLKKCNRKLQKLPAQRLTDLERAQHARFVRKRQNCKHLGLEFTIPLEEIEWPDFCPILGIKLDYFAPYRSENSVSFDRVDNNKGYISDNVIICSWRANRIKNDGTAEEHRRIADYMDYGY